MILNEQLTFNSCSKMLAESSGRAFSSVISKLKMFPDLGYNTFTTVYNCGVVPGLHYGCSIWGYSNRHCQTDLV